MKIENVQNAVVALVNLSSEGYAEQANIIGALSQRLELAQKAATIAAGELKKANEEKEVLKKAIKALTDELSTMKAALQ